MKTFALALLAFSTLAFASDLRIAPKGQVGFLAVGKPSFLKINGKGTYTTGTLKLDKQILSGVLEFDLSSLNTGISLRDEHMKNKYLEVGKFQKARLKIEKLSVPASFNGTIPFTGILSFHGVSKKVSGQAALTRQGQEMIANASFPVILSEFGITIPKYAGITVADEVKVNAEVHAVPMSTKQ